MPESATPGDGAAKGRLVGFAALGALLVLVGVAFYSSREGRESGAPPPQPPAATAATPSQSPVPVPQEPVPAATPPPATTSTASPDLTRTPRGTESLPKTARQGGGTVSTTIEDIALSPKARLMAERLKCVCGCNDILATCTCKKTPGSRDMKKYLQELVTAGKTPSEVESAMVARYGEKVLP